MSKKLAWWKGKAACVEGRPATVLLRVVWLCQSLSRFALSLGILKWADLLKLWELDACWLRKRLPRVCKLVLSVCHTLSYASLSLSVCVVEGFKVLYWSSRDFSVCSQVKPCAWVKAIYHAVGIPISPVAYGKIVTGDNKDLVHL